MPTRPTSSTTSRLSATKRRASLLPRCRNSRRCFTTASMSYFYNRRPPRSITVRKNKRAMKTNMNKNVIKLSAPVRGAAETELDNLKARLLQPLMEKTSDQDAEAALCRAGTEAAALAWTTPFPLLFLPALLDEKVDRAERYLARQKSILQRGSRRAMAA